MPVATLNGMTVTRCSLVIPRWGIPWGDVQVSSGEELSGPATLILGGLTFVGTIQDGSPYRERGWYRIVGGAGGWSNVVSLVAFRNDAGVKLSNVLQSVSTACGETMGTVPPQERIGPGYLPFTCEGSHVLDLLSEESWYVDEQGITQLGSRPATAFEASYVLTRSDPSGRLITVACEDISKLLPGAQLEGIEASSVRHELTPDGLRSHVWGLLDEEDRLMGGIKSLVQWLTHSYEYTKLIEYKTTKAGDGYLDLRPVRSALGYPDLANIPMRTGIPGGGGEPALGSTVLVGFVDGDPTRPFVAHYEGEAGSSWIPTKARLDASQELALGPSALDVLIAEALGRVLRNGDLCTFVVPCNAGGTTTFTGPIQLHPSMASPGAPGAGFSKVKA